ncbi:hypothetical protein CAC42_3577 [Sphaceloma murrayae]|uniref:Alpha-glucuronidase n=1 Tax=Sphaceloma murrayae TaxID=2082308 RepID=A0A2K1QSV1_9PEZI|nr:hypothetical protein CAC42_3577 [Sphaceloma murrayae]
MFFFALLLVVFQLASAEDGLEGWLRYARLPDAQQYQASVPTLVAALNGTEGSPVFTAGQELKAGLEGIFGVSVEVASTAPLNRSNLVTVGTLDQLNSSSLNRANIPELIDDGFYLSVKGAVVNIVGQNERGALYGAFEYLSMLAQGNVTDVDYASNPDAPIRWINQWDNLRANFSVHGSIERGYGGPSIFFENGFVKQNLTRVAQYARLLSSIGINAVVVTNVNADERLLTTPLLDGLKRIADIMRPYGVQLGMSLFFASPSTLGGLSTFDPLDQRVIDWWEQKTNEVYARIPDMAGYLVKANSEGQPGPITYNRTLAEGANLFAKALAPHNGIVMFRAFVYDHKSLNQTANWKADRANAAVEFFRELDGKFDSNVVVQVKYGPIDFQVREPVSPLFAHLRETASAVELQISQEYLGQQCHLVYLPPLWDTIMNFDLRVDSQPSPVRDIVAGRRFNKTLGGYAGVANVGTNTTWLGSHLAMSNLYAFGRIAWQPTLSPVSILDAWTALTFSSNPTVLQTIQDMSLASWPAYENYTGNLGVQTLTDIIFGHYGPNPASQDNNPWGQWTRADAKAIGMDRTVYNGTGYSGQYPAEIAALYEDPETTPEELLLWFHHTPWDKRLSTGETIIQRFYDAHYAGAQTAEGFLAQWESLRGLVDEQRWAEVDFRFRYQAGHAITWRDTVNDFYRNMTGIEDELGRVGNHPYRIEAEAMDMVGYKRYAVAPWNAASGGWAAVTEGNRTTGELRTVVQSETGKYDVAVNYFDMAIGRSTWELWLGEKLVGQWKGDSDLTLGHAPSNYIDSTSATRITFKGVDVVKGETLRVVGKPDGIEPAPVDYVSIFPEGVVD